MHERLGDALPAVQKPSPPGRRQTRARRDHGTFERPRPPPTRASFLGAGSGAVALLALAWFLAAATAEAAPAFRKTITINPGQVTGGPLTNFPFLFSTTDPNLKTTANGGRVTNVNEWHIIFATTPTCTGSTNCGGNGRRTLARRAASLALFSGLEVAP